MPTPKYVHVLIFGSCEYKYVTWHKGLPHAIKVMNFKIGIILDYLGGPNLIQFAFKNRTFLGWRSREAAEEESRRIPMLDSTSSCKRGLYGMWAAWRLQDPSLANSQQGKWDFSSTIIRNGVQLTA